MAAGIAYRNVMGKHHGPSGRRRGSDVPVKPGNSDGGKALASDMFESEPDFRFLSSLRQDLSGRRSAPGVDNESFGGIESMGLKEWLDGLGKELHDKTYRPQPVRRVMIPKPGG